VISRWQVLYLLLGDVELDAILVDSGHGANRDRHALTGEHMSLLEEHVGDLVAAGVDNEPLDLPDVTVGGVDVIAAAHSYLSGGKGVVGDGRGVREQLAGHAARPELVMAVVWVHVVVLHRNRPGGGLELFELRDGAAEPDLACRGVEVDKVERDKPTLELAVVDHKMGDGTGARVNDQAAHLAADPIGTGDVSPIVNGVVSATATSPLPPTVA